MRKKKIEKVVAIVIEKEMSHVTSECDSVLHEFSLKQMISTRILSKDILSFDKISVDNFKKLTDANIMKIYPDVKSFYIMYKEGLYNPIPCGKSENPSDALKIIRNFISHYFVKKKSVIEMISESKRDKVIVINLHKELLCYGMRSNEFPSKLNLEGIRKMSKLARDLRNFAEIKLDYFCTLSNEEILEKFPDANIFCINYNGYLFNASCEKTSDRDKAINLIKHFNRFHLLKN